MLVALSHWHIACGPARGGPAPVRVPRRYLGDTGAIGVIMTWSTR